MLRRDRTIAAERALLDLLDAADGEDFSELVRANEDLMSTAADHLGGPEHRAELIALLLARRSELDVDATASVIWALQRGHTDARDEAVITDLLLGHSGADFLRLRSALSARPDHHDLEQLVFGDIDSRALRLRILDHIAAQAIPLTDVHVVSDIDDTMVARLRDERVPKGTRYPGALAFLAALDAGPDDRPATIGDLTFVTARPRDAFGIIENSSRESLRRAGIRRCSVLTGRFFALRSHSAMAQAKLNNIAHLRLLYPEYGVVFVGDDGQGDAQVAAELLSRYPSTMRAAFIHDVLSLDPAERTAFEGKGIHLFDTYVGAATTAHELGLVSMASVRQVVTESRHECAAVVWQDEAQQRRFEGMLTRDIERADR